MSIGFQVALGAVPFLDRLDEEEAALAAQVAEKPDAVAVGAAMDACRQRLALAVDDVVRTLPSAVRGDPEASRAIAYALVGLVDGRMLHHASGGLQRWRDQLLESELYGSALAGQDVVDRARAAAHGVPDPGSDLMSGSASVLAPFYLAVFRAGFEGALRGDAVGRSALITALEEACAVHQPGRFDVPPDSRPRKWGLAPLPLAGLGIAAWLLAGFAAYFVLSGDSLADTDRLAQRLATRSAVTEGTSPLERSIGPSGLHTPDDP